MCVLLLFTTGDYSDAQLLRVHRQAVVLNRYYELVADAISTHQRTDGNAHYLVSAIASQAGRALGDERVVDTTVRLWHYQYANGKGLFKADERGHHTRELLILEEDIKGKFVKWSLSKAKTDDLSVESAQEYLNTQLLNTLEVGRICCACSCSAPMHLVTLPCLCALRHKP